MGSRNGTAASWIRRLCIFLLGLLTLLTVPSWLCGLESGALFDGGLEAQLPLVRAVAAHSASPIRFDTGSPRFDGEWRFVTLQMSVLGLGQFIRAHPEQRAMWMPAIERCIDRMIAADTLAFGTDPWHMSGLEFDKVPAPAWTGYLNMALGMHRLLEPGSRFIPLHDRLTAALVRRMVREPFAALATYPGETYPPDMATVAGSVGLYQRATGRDEYEPALKAWLASFQRQAVDPLTGLVYQSLDTGSGSAADKPRASGTAFSVYFLSFADPGVSGTLYQASRSRCAHSFAGFGGISEYPEGVTAGRGDVDSGPVIFGVGASATAFSLSGARIHGDRGLYRELMRTACLLGTPVERGGTRRFVLGGSLADAVMLAMATAPVGGEP